MRSSGWSGLASLFDLTVPVAEALPFACDEDTAQSLRLTLGAILAQLAALTPELGA